MREKISVINKKISVTFEESKLKGISKSTILSTSYRVYKDGLVGIYFHNGPVEDEDGYAKAEKNLVREREYPFELESGVKSVDKREKVEDDLEVRRIAEACMEYLTKTYPDYSYKATVSQEEYESKRSNEAGMDYTVLDACVRVDVGFKHKDSTDLLDGAFDVSMRTFSTEKFKKMADDYLEHFNDLVELPEELIIDQKYYGPVSIFGQLLNGENIALKASLLSDKISEKVFSDKFNLYHDVSDEELWFREFWDGDGCVIEGGKLYLVENGVVKTGYADKKTAKKYQIPHTKTAYTSLTDIPGAGGLSLKIGRSEKTVKELLNGRLAAIPVLSYGGGFNEKGDYNVPVHSSLLFDGEKVLGKLPPFTIVTNLFDMFGDGFIGVGSDDPVYNDKQLLYRAKLGKL